VSVARHRDGVYTDVVCAWSTVALHRFYQQRRQAGLEDRVRVEQRLVLLEDVHRFRLPERYLDAEILVVGKLAPELEWKPWQNHPSP